MENETCQWCVGAPHPYGFCNYGEPTHEPIHNPMEKTGKARLTRLANEIIDMVRRGSISDDDVDSELKRIRNLGGL